MSDVIELYDQVRLAQVLSEAHGLQRASVQIASVEDQRGIALSQVQLLALAVACRFSIAQLIVRKQRPIGGQTSLRTPTAVVNPTQTSSVKRRAVCPGLATRNDRADKPTFRVGHHQHHPTHPARAPEPGLLQVKSLREIAAREGVDNSYVSRMVNLTNLAPDIVDAILDDALPDLAPVVRTP